MMLGMLISCLVFLLILRFLYLGRTSKSFKVATAHFGNKNNEAVIIQKEQACLIMVTDPVGSLRTGESACLMAKQIITQCYEASHVPSSPTDFLKKACLLAHRGISEQMNANSGGCSLALVYIHQKQMSYASVGDIGIYLCDDELKQMNPFDLYKYQLRPQVLQGRISEDKLLNNRLRNELTAYLGHENLKKVNVSHQPIRLVKRDKLLIATQDVYDVLPPLKMEAILLEERQPTRWVALLEKCYQERKPAHAKKPSTASVVMMSHFK